LPAAASLEDLRHDAGADGFTALGDRKAQPISMAIGLISSLVILMLSPGMTISTPRQLDRAGHIGGAEINAAGTLEKRRMPPPSSLAQ